MASPPSTTITGLREFFARSEKDKLSADLGRALNLLQLEGLDALEERFLATDAFLRPWSIFRDSILLLWPDSLPRATWIKKNASETGITRTEILSFYSRFDEGTMRYDARADRYSLEYNPDSSTYGVIDKSGWPSENYEKHLYAWLLQEFKIGKKRNVFGFRYFELQAAAKAWETVFVPIVNAVRASYDVKGRRFYGRLALFVESRCPSRLAFPEDNIGVTKTELLSPTPFRMVSVPKKVFESNSAAFARRLNGPGMLTKKHYDETEKELRNVYPQYGGLVERPKFKIKMEVWLAEQRVRADARKALEKLGEVQSSQPQIVQYEGVRSETNTGWPNVQSEHELSHKESGSPIKRTYDSIKRSISHTVSKQLLRETPKSPLHGVTRQLYFPDDDPPSPPQSVEKNQQSPGRERCNSLDSSSTVVITPWPRPETNRRVSELSVYTSIRNANPFIQGSPERIGGLQSLVPRENTERQPKNQPGTILHLMQEEKQHTEQSANWPLPQPSIRPQQSLVHMRSPSYEGNGYADEISLTKLHTTRKDTSRTPRPTRLPIPIKPTAYNGPLRVAHPAPAPKKVPWPGFEDDNDNNDNDISRPPVPPKSPDRIHHPRSQTSPSQAPQTPQQDSRSVTRIVSKANIRAAIGNVSHEGSREDLPLPPPLPLTETHARSFSPGGSRLHTYNTHLFPRKERRGGLLGVRAVGQGRRGGSGGAFEMEGLVEFGERGEGGKG
ncbi:hypothetical protein LEMA_P035890.1 [Plenodomus lingam JN3]|uniref:Uncharacterized protein n=2 Tax=Leptosphaeria maculans TaxID=5022 RepID=E4ZRR8_LEPMJ|nr:hypothetical protein LEMA_P035890.1 [Plenodomus lingam JN3]CBX93915.1 hypothetical protein LEMA_P035890.1 [Plenodomus lingam JN3]